MALVGNKADLQDNREVPTQVSSLHLGENPTVHHIGHKSSTGDFDVLFMYS